MREPRRGPGHAPIQPGGTDAKAKEPVATFFRIVPVLDSGVRGVATTCVERGIGDVPTA